MGRLQVEDFIKRTDEGKLDLPADQDGWQALKERVTGNILYVDNIISSNGNVTALAIQVESDPGDDSYKARLTRQIKKITAASGLEEEFYFAGPPVFVTFLEQCD